MQKFIFFILTLAFLVSFNLQAFAQGSTGSDGGTTPPPLDPTLTPADPALGGSAVSSPTAPALVPTPAPASGTTPVKPKVALPKPKPILTPTLTPPITEVDTQNTLLPVPESGNGALPVALGVLGAGVLGVLGFFGLRSQQNKKNGPCDVIKKTRDTKDAELSNATNKFSLQEALVGKLKGEVENQKEKIQKNLIKKAELKTLETIGSVTLSKTVALAEEAKKVYDSLSGKYEKAKNLLEILRQRKGALTSERDTLNSSYNQCLLQMTTSIITPGAGVKFFVGQNSKKTTLLFLHKPLEKKILLAMKRRSFGKGKWNGVGGKLNDGESIIDALIRETKEEIGVKISPNDLVQVATLDFYFKNNSDWNQETHVFFVEKWEGEPVETEEMNPKWHSTEALPYENMWVDDPHWLPLVLQGKKLNANFIFSKNGDEILDMKIKEIS